MTGIPSIIRKIETMEELTEEERDQFLQFVQEPFLSMLDEWEYSKVNIIRLKIINSVCKQGNAKEVALAKSAKFLMDIPKDKKMIKEDVLNCVSNVHIDSSPQNMSLLLQLLKIESVYIFNEPKIFSEFTDWSFHPDKDYPTSVVEESQEKIESAKRKVKELREQYPIHNGRK